MKKTLLIVVIVILLAVLCFSSWQLIKIWREYRLGEVTYESMEAYVDVPETTAPKKPQKAEEETVETVPEESGILWPEVDFDALREINPDVVGWLYIEGTNISYPVVQGDDNDFYLYRLITGEYNIAGSLFLEAGLSPDFSDQNNPVYGHNMKNGTMFAALAGYKKQEFYEEHPVALLMTPEQNYQVVIFSAYVQQTDGDAWNTIFTEESMQKWLDGRLSKSWISTGVTPAVTDKVLTLSTCSYELSEARFLVHGILVPEKK